MTLKDKMRLDELKIDLTRAEKQLQEKTEFGFHDNVPADQLEKRILVIKQLIHKIEAESSQESV